jgi:predicted dehydrogenase
VNGEAGRLKVAILSFAHTHALSYARQLAARDDIELVASDPNGREAPDAAARGAALAADLGVRYLESYDDVFAWGPDAVIVTAENARHRELVERAAAAGAHILCEKPLATTLEDGQAMLAAVEAARVRLMIAYPVRFSPSFVDARARVRSGQLGAVLGILGTNNGKIPLADRAWFTDEELAGGGALVDHVVHCADLLDELLGEPAASVRAVSNRILHASRAVAVETGGLVTLRYPSGVIATIDCSWSVPDSAPTWGGLMLQIVGTKGIVTIAPFAQHVSGYDATGPVFASVSDDLDAAMLDTFLAAVRDNTHPQPDGAVGMRTLQIVDAARRSAVTGQPVSLGRAMP